MLLPVLFSKRQNFTSPKYMKFFQKKNLRWYLLVVITILIVHIFGGFILLMEKDFDKEFIYSFDAELKNLVDRMMEGKHLKPFNTFLYNIESDVNYACETSRKLLFLVKSSPKNYRKRNIIRKTWGSSIHNKDVKTIFLMGTTISKYVNMMLMRENEIMKDLMIGSFIDSYNNLTLKTMMGLKWASNFCSSNIEFFMFVDDDTFVSTKNILKFLQNPYAYPGTEENVKKITNFNADQFCLYSGFIYKTERPIRKIFCKWFIPLKDYPYDKWPPFAAGGAYILSRKSLRMMYYASLFTKPIQLEDVYIGLLAYRLGIEPISNNDNFKVQARYNFEEFRYILAAHGFRKPKELWMIWKEQSLADKKISYIYPFSE